jgi:hypothetical protein
LQLGTIVEVENEEASPSGGILGAVGTVVGAGVKEVGVGVREAGIKLQGFFTGFAKDAKEQFARISLGGAGSHMSSAGPRLR